MARLGAHISDWFLTDSGRRFAEEEWQAREKECRRIGKIGIKCHFLRLALRKFLHKFVDKTL